RSTLFPYTTFFRSPGHPYRSQTPPPPRPPCPRDPRPRRRRKIRRPPQGDHVICEATFSPRRRRGAEISAENPTHRKLALPRGARHFPVLSTSLTLVFLSLLPSLRLSPRLCVSAGN